MEKSFRVSVRTTGYVQRVTVGTYRYTAKLEGLNAGGMVLENPEDMKLLRRVRTRTQSVVAPDYKQDMKAICEEVGIPFPEHEYTFARGRKWRFDYAWPDKRIAIEVDGGILKGGRHTSSVSGRLRDMEKLNTAVSLGWLVLTASTLQKSINDKRGHTLPWLSLRDPLFAYMLSGVWNYRLLREGTIHGR